MVPRAGRNTWPTLMSSVSSYSFLCCAVLCYMSHEEALSRADRDRLLQDAGDVSVAGNCGEAMPSARQRVEREPVAGAHPCRHWDEL